MRIVIWTDSYWPEIGGLEVFCQHLAEGLRSRGHSLMVVCNSDAEQTAGQEQVQGIEVHRYAFYQTLHRADLRAFVKVMEECERTVSAFSPDLIHLNVCSKGFMSFALMQRRQRRPVAVTLHDPNIYRNPNGLSREVLAQSNQVTAVSDFMSRDALVHMPELKGKIRIILNSLPRPARDPIPCPLEPALLFLGRLTREKGLDLAIEAFAQVAAEFPDSRLSIAGDGAQRSLLEELTVGLGLKERVRFLGWQQPGEINDFIDRHSGIIMPSRWDEPFGLVALQAAQRARPICASRTGGIPEIVVDGETGWLFEKENVEDLARTLRNLLGDKPRSQDMGRRAYERALRHFDFSDFLDRYEALYAEIAGSA